MWQRGDVVVVRYELRGFAADGFGRVLPLSRQAVRRAWRGTDIGMIFPFGRRHSFWVFHEGGRPTVGSVPTDAGVQVAR